MAEGEKYMKKGIHPNYVESKVTCACGNEFTVMSTKDAIHLEVCDKCHPFFTGQKQAMSSQGRAAKFMEKYGKKA